MNKETRNTLIVIGVVLILIGGMYIGVRAYSGVNPPFTVINSGSMMHSDDSKIGIIDTGDMIVVKDPDTLNIHTYVDGAKSGYRSFGEYGDVIVYMKPNQNIIHRAMIYMELKSNSMGTIVWYIPSLQGYDKWNVTPDSTYSDDRTHRDLCWNEETGELTLTYDRYAWMFWLEDVGYAGLNVNINLYTLGTSSDEGDSGYLTKGDNASTNTRFDQCSGIYENKLVQKDKIKSVAVFEIPWIGAIKLMLKGNGDSVPSNSKLNLLLTFIALIVLIVLINFIINRISAKLSEKKE